MSKAGRQGRQKYDRNQYLVLQGTGGLVDGESFRVYLGQSLTVGRSADCDISLKKCRTFREAGGVGIVDKPGFLKVSRLHFRISFHLKFH